MKPAGLCCQNGQGKPRAAFEADSSGSESDTEGEGVLALWIRGCLARFLRNNSDLN